MLNELTININNFDYLVKKHIIKYYLNKQTLKIFAKKYKKIIIDIDIPKLIRINCKNCNLEELIIYNYNNSLKKLNCQYNHHLNNIDIISIRN